MAGWWISSLSSRFGSLAEAGRFIRTGAALGVMSLLLLALPGSGAGTTRHLLTIASVPLAFLGYGAVVIGPRELVRIGLGRWKRSG